VVFAWVTAWTGDQPVVVAQVANATSRQQSALKAELRTCFDAAARNQPGLSVDTQAMTLFRGERTVFVDIEIADQPQLVACFTRAIMERKLPSSVVARGDELGAGGIALRFVPAELPRVKPKLGEVRARLERFERRALASGVVQPRDRLYDEWMHAEDTPAWPTPSQLEELQTCYCAALHAHPGLVLHRDVFYLQRDGTVLFADVQIPEAPELARCIAARVQAWQGRFARAPISGTFVTSFKVDFGAPPEFPDRSEGESMVTRRDAFLQRAMKARVLASDDPLWQRYDISPATAQ
jgi:hypothetical protein